MGATRDISKDAAAGTSLPQPTNTAVVNAHPTQNINSEFAECSTGTDVYVPGWGCQWVPAPGGACKDWNAWDGSLQVSMQQFAAETPIAHFASPPQVGCTWYL